MKKYLILFAVLLTASCSGHKPQRIDKQVSCTFGLSVSEAEDTKISGPSSSGLIVITRTASREDETGKLHTITSVVKVLATNCVVSELYENN